MIKIDFTINGYCDALHLADDHSFTDAEIEAMKQSRYNKWDAFIKNPPAPVAEELVVEELVVDAPVEE